ncbi:uncharacterized protein H6S33_004108 [Morchella sextelata]|uniref:uncharacterized protein n=1 Tax=Morchella sextelata TaxID=1174677 RepID=UPI001D03CF1C|nr:uncharacterized protein H6S33_004108 [Morchella sextelata]KAH0606447.1 hypothetical protein H6S33_004108 [Morchella sextelata]
MDSTWADYPFPLISTPACDIGYTNQFIKSASKMALTHNIIIRGMNSIYLQCMHITPYNAADFITYCQCWAEFIHNHHDCEEAAYFPLIEKAVGTEGMAEENIEQHEAFMGGLNDLDAYLRRVDPYSFSGSVVLQILETFAAKLQMHLTDEIVWIQSLATNYPTLNLAEIDMRHGAYVGSRSTRTRVLPFFLTNHDKTYEGGIHSWWPTGNKIRDWWLRYVCTLVYSGAWQFSSCSKGGKPKRLEGIRRGGLVEEAPQERGEVGEVMEMNMAPKRPEASIKIQARTNTDW